MAEFCSGDRGIITTSSMDDLSECFPEATVVYSGGALLNFKTPGVAIWDSAGTQGSQKVVRINGVCPQFDGEKCKLAGKCFAKNSDE